MAQGKPSQSVEQLYHSLVNMGRYLIILERLSSYKCKLEPNKLMQQELISVSRVELFKALLALIQV